MNMKVAEKDVLVHCHHVTCAYGDVAVVNDVNFTLHRGEFAGIVGPSGSGKTTFTYKLAYHLKNKKKFRPLMVAADVYRPAAMEQLKALGEKINVPVFVEMENKNPLDIAQKAIQYAKTTNCNIIIRI